MIQNDASNKLILVDFHVHTHYSKDSLTSPGKLLQKMGGRVDQIVITDHNTIKGAVEARKIEPEHIIIGEEIMTAKGEILAVFVQEEIPSGLEPQEVIHRLRDQHAFISVSHPFDRFRNGSWLLEDLIAILPEIDAIEGFNARVMTTEANRSAMKFASVHNLLITAGSDAHTIFEVGKAGILLPEFRDTDELRENLSQGNLIVKKSPWWVHIFSTYAKFQKKKIKG